ncbi:hypothetical protein C1646_806545 [Rhizophagus diaphanus]|nr:hypothetical protein C1646_806545 [Rhizophagus diaphanus] [Rhizophagus sp. MUCL 43196]
MNVFGETCEYEQKFKNSIRSVSSALQKSEANILKKSEQDAEISKNEHRWSNDSNCHHVGCSCSLLYDQHWRSSDGDFSQNMAVSTFESVGRINIDFSGKQGCNTISNKCDMKIRASENYKNLVQSIANRKTHATNQNLCNNDIYTRSETTLQELQNKRKLQYTQDLPLLLKLLNNEYPYRNESNKNVLTDREIRLFTKMYGITDFRLMFVIYDNSVFWLEDPKGIYFWFRIDDSMIRGGDNLIETLTNYLFYDKNLCYVDEYTCKLVPINAYDKEAEEWAKLPEKYFAKIDVTEILQKHKSEMDGKKN